MKSDPELFAGSRRVRGVCVLSGSTRLAEMAARIGFDTVWIEMEHGPAGFDQVESLCMAVEAGGAVPTVRISDNQRHHMLRALEAGAIIVVVPMINTAEQASDIVRHGKYPPIGSRGFNTRSRGVRYGLAGPGEPSFKAANARTHLFAQIESVEAVKNLEAICAVKGLSGIFIGPGDLSISMGCPGQLTNPNLIETISTCIRTARSRGLHAGILAVPSPLLDAAIAAGADLVFCGGDFTELAIAWPKLLESVSEKVPEVGPGA
ncbi:MAG TPA: aldolase/citrate lyase family protein [Tepidisphaeraceae bacterium]|jgi:4-hydroxy-2-oxoheptanedioate aldolase|nr:aldolase/citrate lyase family protein [Tepidisphaeraceae bacterium]